MFELSQGGSLKKSRHMSSLILVFLFLSVDVSATSQVKRVSLRDPDYQFDQTKLDAAENSFMFLRSFVDYFYLVIRANQANLSSVRDLQSASGWCVGDAHPENFGVLLQKDSKGVFTMNDMDDGGPCPVGLDLLRLMVSSRLYSSGVELGQMINAYVNGLASSPYTVPIAVEDLLKKSQKRGMTVNPKKVFEKTLVRDRDMKEVSPKELAQIRSALFSLAGVISPKAQILDVVSMSKVGGGSGGLLRYEVLIDNAGNLVHLEIKEQPGPAIYPVATGPIPKVEERIAKATSVTQFPQPSEFYVGLSVNGRDMLLRPRFYGNQGLSLGQQSDGEFQEIVSYEAYVLGVLHSRSVSDKSAWVDKVKGISEKSLEKEVTSIADHFKAKYSSLK